MFAFGYVSKHNANLSPDEDARIRNEREKRKRRKQSKALYVVLVAMALIAGLLGGYALDEYVISPIRPHEVLPSALTEDQLDELVGTYTFDGKLYGITARAAIEDSCSIDSMRLDDGTYECPSGDMIFSYARNRILVALADGLGVVVNRADVESYVRDYLGVSDISLVLQTYDMGEDQAYRLLEEAARVSKVREYAVGTLDGPVAPAAPQDATSEVANEGYFQYILTLLGDHWDYGLGTWADTENAYYEALSGMDFGGDLANYEAAIAAYNIANDEYMTWVSSADDRWEAYINQYLDKAAVTIGTLHV